ncbi:MAG: DUF3817 domain-containing protein [Bernardetiaceae bacterium]
MERKASIAWLRLAAITEGISYLLLLLVGMPIKYGLGYGMPNYVIGLAHGVLFVAYVLLVVVVAWQYRWPIGKTLIALGASLLPLATFWVERKWLREEA